MVARKHNNSTENLKKMRLRPRANVVLLLLNEIKANVVAERTVCCGAVAYEILRDYFLHFISFWGRAVLAPETPPCVGCLVHPFRMLRMIRIMNF